MFEVTLSHCEPIIKNKKRINLDNFKIKKLNKTTRAVTGSFELFENVNDDIEVESFKSISRFLQLISDRLSHLQEIWKRIQVNAVQVGPKRICQFVKEEKLFYPNFITRTNFPPPPSCAIKVGVYYINFPGSFG